MIAEFDDPRLVAVYDAVNAYAPAEQPDYYAGVATEAGARTVVELGSGTGMVCSVFAARGFAVTGIEPSAAMLAVARRRAGCERVQWVAGGADALGTLDADFAYMSGHVAQFFVEDDDWHAALRSLHGALRPGGRLSFESRNPLVREWERWTPEHRRVVHDERAGAIETWSEVHAVRDGVVHYANHYVFVTRGEELVSRARLRFRTRDELSASLSDAGFAVERVDGDWDGRPATESTRELIFVATRVPD